MTTDVELPSLTAMDNYSGLLETLYGSLSDNNGFENFLAKFKDEFNSASATLMAIQTQPRQMRWGWRVGIPEKIERWYIENGMVAKDPSIDLFEEMSKTQPGFITTRLSLADIDLVDAVNDDFRNWLIEARVIDTTGLMFPASDNEFLILALQRNQPAGRFRQEEINRLNILVPHIKQALQLFIRIYRQKHDNTSLQAAINTLSRPTIVISELMQIRHINTAAVSLIRHNKKFRIEEGRLILQDAELHRQFMFQTWEMAGAAEKPGHALTSTLAIPDIKNPVAVTLAPMLVSDRPAGFKGVLLQIFDPSSQTLPKARHIQSIFRLTKTESVLCEYLVHGCTLKDIAKRRKVSINTIREQMRNIFYKTGHSRQSELIASILRAVP